VIASTSINEFFPGHWSMTYTLTVTELTLGFK